MFVKSRTRINLTANLLFGNLLPTYRRQLEILATWTFKPVVSTTRMSFWDTLWFTHSTRIFDSDRNAEERVPRVLPWRIRRRNKFPCAGWASNMVNILLHWETYYYWFVLLLFMWNKRENYDRIIYTDSLVCVHCSNPLKNGTKKEGVKAWQNTCVWLLEWRWAPLLQA